MAVADEHDVLPRNLDWYDEIPLVVVDNGSTDGYELCLEGVRNGTILEVERVDTQRFEWRRVLAALIALARRHEPEFVLLTAPDEFFQVADGTDLLGAIEEDLDAGYNRLDFQNMEFQMTEEDDAGEPDVLDRMRHYAHRPVTMPRCFPLLDGVDAVSFFGHQIVFPPGVEARPSPRVYLSRHYPLRTTEQAQAKIARMLARAQDEPVAGKYVRIHLDPDSLYVRKTRLTRYREDNRWSFEDRYAPARAKQTERALARLYRDYRELEDRYAELEDRYAELEARSAVPNLLRS